MKASCKPITLSAVVCLVGGSGDDEGRLFGLL